MTAGFRFFDRIGREWTTNPPDRALSGQYLVDGAVSLGGVQVGPQALLVDSDQDSIDVVGSDVAAKVVVLHGEDDASLDAAVEVAAQVEQWRELGAHWQDIVQEVPPIIQIAGVSERLEADRLEIAFGDHLPQLRHVFLSPFTELHYESERLPAARARRVSRRATQVLAARTEDWLRVGAAGVTPRRVESLVRDEVADIYENRVAARLLDTIQRHLKRTLAVYAQLGDLVGHEVSGWWRQERRLYELWGSQPPGAEVQALLLQRRADIERLLMATARFRDGRLYQEVPDRARVQQPIRVTNLLADDPNYRAVRRVWAEWWRSRADKPSAEERRISRVSLTNAFESFAWLTAAHAISRMESTPGISDSTHGTFPTVRTPWGEMSLSPDTGSRDAAWRLSISTSAGVEPVDLADIVPLGCEILSGSEASVRTRLEVLGASTTNGSQLPVLVLYPGTGRDLRALPRDVQGLAHRQPPVEPVDTSTPDRWIVPISPLDLESIERVEQAIRWLTLVPPLLRYPPAVSNPQAIAPLIRDRFLDQPATTENLVALRRPSTSEWDAFKHRVEAEARRFETMPKQQGVRKAAELRAGLGASALAISHLDPLLRCPVCFGVGDLLPRAAETYEVICRGCKARWGLRRDSEAGGERIPYLWISDEGSSPPSGPDLGRWLGRDVLSAPCAHTDAIYGTEIVNPWSGQCTASAAMKASCTRCRSSSQ